MEEAPAFCADAMLGTLARWLRLLGYDCLYDSQVADDRLIERARAEGRVVLTRDRGVAKRAGRSVFVPSDDLDEQILRVAEAVGLTLPEEPPTTRCSLCNALLEPAPAASIGESELPERVRAGQTEFWRCPGCRRLYWKGTHFTSMGERLKRLRSLQASAPQRGAESP